MLVTIMVVEGDENLARLFTEIFKFQGWHADSFTDASTSRDAINGDKHYDIVFTSYRVSGTTGVEIIKQIRKTDHRRHVPVVLLTGSGGIENEAYAAGVTEVLQKPVDMHALIKAVKRHVPHASAGTTQDENDL
ncbi:MAG TPA: response regulator [Blastocatellia bacterium]|nr:response regulator [Blastocatellia bacterium]